jgi:hypothetical protein
MIEVKKNGFISLFYFLKKMVGGNKDDFLKFMSGIGWVGDRFVDALSCCEPCREEIGFMTMDIMKLKRMSEKVGLYDEVIVFLAKKVFNFITRTLIAETGCDNIDSVDKKSEMVRCLLFLNFCFF